VRHQTDVTDILHRQNSHDMFNW